MSNFSFCRNVFKMCLLLTDILVVKTLFTINLKKAHTKCVSQNKMMFYIFVHVTIKSTQLDKLRTKVIRNILPDYTAALYSINQLNHIR